MNLPLDASKDQSNCPAGYYRRKDDMLHQIEGVTKSASDSSPDLSRLDSMTPDELKSLIKRISGARWGEVALMSADERYAAIIDKAAYLALTASDVNEFIKAGTQYMERTKGKVADRIEQSVSVSGNVAIVSKEDVANIISGWLETSKLKTIEHDEN